jgi:hypothetical protein
MHFDKKISVASFVCKQLQRKKKNKKIVSAVMTKKIVEIYFMKTKKMLNIIQSVEDYINTYREVYLGAFI